MEEKQALELFLESRTEEAFCALFEILYGRVRRYFVLRGLDLGTAEELAQNVLLTVYRRAGEVRDRDLFNGWLFRVARNEMISHHRRRGREDWLIAFEPLSGAFAAQRAVNDFRDEASQFAEWMTYLEPAERELVRLRFIEELSYEELAIALDAPLGTIKWRLFNAKKKLSHIIARSARRESRAPREQ